MSNELFRATIHELNGEITETTEYDVASDRDYSFVTNGDFEWQFFDTDDWVTFDSGTVSGFVATAPPSKKIRLVVNSGTVTFSFSSRRSS